VTEEQPNFKWYVSETADDAAADAARAIARQIRQAVEARGFCTLAFSGGRSPEAIFVALAREQLPWESVHVFQVDERAAPDGSKDRNWTGLKTSLLDKVSIPARNLHPMPVTGASLEESARQYVLELEAVCGEPPVLDVVHLGLGSDGHTASLVPGDPVLNEEAADVAPTQVYQGNRRLTLTFPCLRRARRLLWFATGAGKADMLQRLEQGDQEIPAGRLGHARNLIFTDRAAVHSGFAARN
jgi:6-phosphogluconolactonase